MTNCFSCNMWGFVSLCHANDHKFANQRSMLIVLMLSLFSYCAHYREEVVKAEAVSKEKNLTFDQPPDISLWERLGNASALDIESSGFSWNTLSSLHHTEHSSSSEHSEDEMNKALEVCCCLLWCRFEHSSYGC